MVPLVNFDVACDVVCDVACDGASESSSDSISLSSATHSLDSFGDVWCVYSFVKEQTDWLWVIGFCVLSDKDKWEDWRWGKRDWILFDISLLCDDSSTDCELNTVDDCNSDLQLPPASTAFIGTSECKVLL